MKKMFKGLFFITLFCVFQKCQIAGDTSYPLFVENNSDHSIGFYLGGGGRYGTYYPDTLLPLTNKYVINQILPNTSYSYDSGLEWREIFSHFPSDTLFVVYFHSDTLAKYSWSEIREHDKVLRRDVYSYSDLEKLDFYISYP